MVSLYISSSKHWFDRVHLFGPYPLFQSVNLFITSKYSLNFNFKSCQKYLWNCLFISTSGYGVRMILVSWIFSEWLEHHMLFNWRINDHKFNFTISLMSCIPQKLLTWYLPLCTYSKQRLNWEFCSEFSWSFVCIWSKCHTIESQFIMFQCAIDVTRSAYKG